MKHNKYTIYIMTNQRQSVFYVGVTSHLKRRIEAHKAGEGSRFSNRYNTKNCVYYEHFDNPLHAIQREKQLKDYSQRKKELLIGEFNEAWEDVYASL